MAPILRSRLVRVDDAPTCAQWLASGLPVAPALAARLDVLLAGLIRHGQIRGRAVEELSLASGRWTLAALGVTGALIGR